MLLLTFTHALSCHLAAFASYVVLTIRRHTDGLLVAETWDYLRDVLIILATGRLYVGQIPKKTDFELATVAEKITKALELVLARCEKRLGWTKIVCLLWRYVY